MVVTWAEQATVLDSYEHLGTGRGERGDPGSGRETPVGQHHIPARVDRSRWWP
jgi:hypothetical protein